MTTVHILHLSLVPLRVPFQEDLNLLKICSYHPTLFSSLLDTSLTCILSAPHLLYFRVWILGLPQNCVCTTIYWSTSLLYYFSSYSYVCHIIPATPIHIRVAYHYLGDLGNSSNNPPFAFANLYTSTSLFYVLQYC